jgi:glycosyltransferase involved in cell wall biosynthesis
MPMANTTSKSSNIRIAVLIPCYNEAHAIGKVVTDFRRELPNSVVYVYDNNSVDQTKEIANAAGAIVREEKRQGKGYVISKMFEEVDADLYVLVDGDGTYDPASVHRLIHPLIDNKADMTVGSRLVDPNSSAFPRFHVAGNRVITGLINLMFHSKIQDLFSGYRGLTRELVKSIPIVAGGFDVETELALQALYRRFVICEVPTPYGVRAVGSHSKLRTIPDGISVIVRAFLLLKAYKPMTFFGLSSLGAAALALWSAYAPIQEYLQSHYVYSVPRAVLAAALALASLLSLSLGVTLHTINFRLLELEKVLKKHKGDSNPRNGHSHSQ